MFVGYACAQPVIDCLAEVEIPIDSVSCQGTMTDLSYLVTNDDGSFTITQNPTAGSPVDGGLNWQLDVTITATDGSGNTESCTFEIEIQDLVAPVIDCPGPQIFPNDEGECGAYIDFIPTITDNCGDVTITYIEGPELGGYFPPGQTIVSIEVTDGSGNSTGCSYVVEIVDDQGPLIECQWNIYTSDPLVVYNPPTVIDNCGNYTLEIIQGFESGDIFPYGTTTVEIMAIDPSMNFTTCSFTVYVNEGPTAVPDIFETHLREINFFPLANDLDPENDPLYIESVEMIPNLRLELNGSMTYFPNHETCEGDSILYTIRDVHGETSSSYIKIDVTCPDLVEVPEGFSPNNDGINDFLIIEGIEDFPGSKLTIFNEWGNIVYQISNYQNDWNGVANRGWLRNENLLPEANYYYVLVMPYNSIIKKGTLYLKR